MEPKFSKDVYGTILEKKLAKPDCFGRYLGSRIGNRTVVELCCCLGVQLIQIAKMTQKQAVGVDINEKVVRKAQKNAKLYSVSNVEFIVGDALDSKLLKNLTAEVAILDPHWSVTKTLQRDFAHTLHGTSPAADTLVKLVRRYITANIIIELPYEMPNKELRELGDCEIQNVKINSELKQKFVFYGDLKRAESSEIQFNFIKGTVPDKLRTRRLA